ncbi:MAG: hypothetical protein J2P25_12910 [Nocardiopsaceae bacterium]|nr:hypothetical protein [Nocardiopsaceae bacterium]
MRFLAAVVIGVLLGTGAVLVLVHDSNATEPAPVRAVFNNLAPYKPQPTTHVPYNYGSGG